MTRTGLESEAVKRLLRGIHDDAVRQILARCLEGSISPAVALMQMLIETEDAVVVRAAVDDVTRLAATLSRSGDSFLRDRVDDLTQLMVENEQGCTLSRSAATRTSGMSHAPLLLTFHRNELTSGLCCRNTIPAIARATIPNVMRNRFMIVMGLRPL